MKTGVNTQGNLNVERIGGMGMPLPSLKEQQRIMQKVESETGSFSTVISHLDREIDLLHEYRTRLVADVVTGKLDVREAAARLPDETPPDTADDDVDMSDETEPADEGIAE
jgi:type I restriction enzyme S subunit